MAERRFPRQDGFSMVEMLVAMVFTLILMAGMANVFKGTFSSFVAASEKTASSRRNRLSIDLLYDDLNNAGMYLTDLTTPPTIYAGNEAFQVVPWPTALAGVTQGADELFFYMDEPLGFEGSLTANALAKNSDALANATAAAGANDLTFTIECNDATFASQVAAGQNLVFKDAWETPPYIATANPVSAGSSQVKVVLAADPSVASTGRGFNGVLKYSHLTGTGVVFLKPAQMVHYCIKLLNLDPANTSAQTVCLVREQGPYTSGAFTAASQQVITENVSGFRVFLSADSGNHWVGGGAQGTSDWPTVKTALNAQLANYGRPGHTSVTNDLQWFRSTPVLVRIDVTTRTATQRAEYSATGTTAAYKEQVQSMVMVPRHFGLTLN